MGNGALECMRCSGECVPYLTHLRLWCGQAIAPENEEGVGVQGVVVPGCSTPRQQQQVPSQPGLVPGQGVQLKHPAVIVHHLRWSEVE